MTRTALLLLAFVLVLGSAGCTVTDKAIDTAKTAAAGNDRYTTLTIKALKGESDLAEDGIAPVSAEDLIKTPAAVRGLIERLLEALHTNRFAWHSELFQLGQGPDPDGMGLVPVALPKKPDDDSDLLEDD
jgi:hypothetical protein